MERYVVVEDSTGRRKLGGPTGVAGGFADTDFDVGGGGQTNFTVGAITALTKIDVFRNGIMLREGSTFDYQRNVGASQIQFNASVTQNAWVRVRIWS